MFRTQKFLKLNDKWQKKLEKSGFEDIENQDGTLKNETDPRTITYALHDKEIRETYYAIAREFLHIHRFIPKIEKSIWADHCQGISLRDIAAEYKMTVYGVRKIVLKLRDLAKLGRRDK